MEHLLQMSLQALGVLQNCGNEVMEVRNQGRGRLHQYDNMRRYQGVNSSLSPYNSNNPINRTKTSIKESCVEHMQNHSRENQTSFAENKDTSHRDRSHILIE